jgi:glycosyltransferase involved in cell wall biosynthesis
VRSPLRSIRARIRQARFAATPPYAWPTRIRTALGRSDAARRIRRATRTVGRRRSPVSIEALTKRRRRPGGRNVLFVSHCNFTGQSAYHVYSIATGLERRGWSPAIAVPGRPLGVRDLGRPTFPVLSFRDAQRGPLKFPDGEGPDIVHAFTPREPVRRLTLDVVRRHGCLYVVHLEDNEMAVRGTLTSTYDPEAIGVFMEEAAGATVIVDRLRELTPEHVPTAVVWPGYDAAIDRPSRPRPKIRRDLGLEDADVAVIYPGNVHDANVGEVRSLYEAVEMLRAGGRKAVLVRSGLTSVPASRLPKLGGGIRDLGWIRRRRVFELLHAADVLVQPGAPGLFNDYRFPSKLPEFLASGRPVVLPRTNIGLHLEDRVEALLLAEGRAEEIREKIALLDDDSELRERVGARGREFAQRELQWAKSVDRVVDLYGEIRDGAHAALSR